jgi:hypothetical protein
MIGKSKYSRVFEMEKNRFIYIIFIIIAISITIFLSIKIINKEFSFKIPLGMFLTKDG